MATTLPTKKAESIFDELNRMHDQIVRRAQEIFEWSGGSPGRELEDWLQAERELVWRPPIELIEKDNEFYLQITVPGVDPKDIAIEVTPEDILVRAELKHAHDESKGTVHVCEFSSGSMFRAVHLPRKIDPDKVKAEFRDGMLNVKAAVAEESRIKKVKVEAA
jgi:HSP20 family protein